MSREKYLKELETRLKKLPQDEIDEALNYYREYFDEAGEENSELVIKKLGSPAQVARHILAEYATKELAEHPESAKKSISAIWFILLAILASPIALPIVIVIISMVFTLVILCAAFLFTFLTLIISLAFAGVVSIIAGFSVITQHWQTSLFYIGAGLTATGIGILLFPPFMFVVKSSSSALARWLNKIFDKMKNKRKEEI